MWFSTGLKEVGKFLLRLVVRGGAEIALDQIENIGGDEGGKDRKDSKGKKDGKSAKVLAEDGGAKGKGKGKRRKKGTRKTRK